MSCQAQILRIAVSGSIPLMVNYLLVPESIIHPVVSTLVYMLYLLLKFTVPKIMESLYLSDSHRNEKH